MAGQSFIGNTKVFWTASAPAAGIGLPTPTEMGAATPLTNLLADGVQISATVNKASSVLLDSGKIAEDAGTQGRAVTLKFQRTAGGSDPNETLFEPRPSGYLIIAEDGDGETAGDEVNVYQCSALGIERMPTAENSKQGFQVQFAVEDWDEAAVVTV